MMTLEAVAIQTLGLEGLRRVIGYKLHSAVDASSDLPLACIIAPANENEKKHAPKLLEKTVKAANGQTKVLVADSQYSSRKLRRHIYSHARASKHSAKIACMKRNCK
jgi:IS5 family transposase